MKRYMRDELTENPDLYVEEMVDMLLEKFEVKDSPSSVVVQAGHPKAKRPHSSANFGVDIDGTYFQPIRKTGY